LRNFDFIEQKNNCWPTLLSFFGHQGPKMTQIFLKKKSDLALASKTIIPIFLKSGLALAQKTIIQSYNLIGGGTLILLNRKQALQTYDRQTDKKVDYRIPWS